MTRLWILVAVLLVLLGCGGTDPRIPTAPARRASAARPAGSEPAAAPTAKAAAPVDAGPIPVSTADATRGNPDALVTLVEFGDLQDPFVARAVPSIRELERRYPPDQLRIVWKHFPLQFHKHAMAAAVAGQAVFAVAGAGAFWAFHDAALAAGRNLDPGSFEAWATAAGTPTKAYRGALAAGETLRKVEEDATLAESLHVVAAPWFFVNGVECSTRTSCTVEHTSERHVSVLVDMELAKSRAALAAGVRPQALYAEMTRQNVAHPPDVPEPPPPPPLSPAGPDEPTFGAKHLLVFYAGSRRAPPGIHRTKEQAKARALQAARKARQKGVHFEDVVAEFSEEPGAAKRGGELGTFKRGTMVSEFQSAVESLQVGEISDPVETPFGFHVIVRTK